MKALVTDAHLRSVVAAIRGLGGAGLHVVALGPRRSSAGMWSRHTSAREVVGESREALAAGVSDALATRGEAVVYPGQESSLDALLGAALPAGSRLPYPDLTALEALRDKRALAGLAADAGLGAPATLIEATASELSSWRPPAACVVKPVGPGGALPTARAVHDAAGLRALVAGLPPDEPLLVQERARPPLFALTVVIGRDGALVARFQQEARRTWPPDAGTSSVAVSVAPDPGLSLRAAAMLRTAGFGGLAQLQFLDVDGRPALIDVNPRFYGSMPLALACGVNLPAAWHASLTADRPGEPADYRIGVTYRWLEGELLIAVRAAPTRGEALRRGARALLVPPRPPRTGAVWSSADPLPGMLAVAETVGGIGARRLSRGEG